MLYLFLWYQDILKLYPVQCSAMLCRVWGGVHSSTLQCNANQQFAKHWSAMQSRELNCCALKLHLKKSFQWSALHKNVQRNSMDTNVHQCSAVECKAAQPYLTKSSTEEEKSLYLMSVSVLLLVLVERFGVSLMRNFFISNFKKWKNNCESKLLVKHSSFSQ